MCGARGGHFQQKLLRHLAEHFLCIIVDEYLTSQLCNVCHEQLDQANRFECRSKRCRRCTVPHRERDANGDHTGATTEIPFAVDRDVNAAFNIYCIFLYMLHHEGERPPEFARPATGNGHQRGGQPPLVD